MKHETPQTPRGGMSRDGSRRPDVEPLRLALAPHLRDFLDELADRRREAHLAQLDREGAPSNDPRRRNRAKGNLRADVAEACGILVADVSAILGSESTRTKTSLAALIELALRLDVFHLVESALRDPAAK